MVICVLNCLQPLAQSRLSATGLFLYEAAEYLVDLLGGTRGRQARQPKITTLMRQKHHRRTTTRQATETPPESTFDPSNATPDADARLSKPKSAPPTGKKNRPQPPQQDSTLSVDTVWNGKHLMNRMDRMREAMLGVAFALRLT